MIKDIYLMRVDGAWGAVIPSKCLTVVNAPKSADLIEFYHELKEMFPEHRMRCVMNKGIADKIRQHQVVFSKMEIASRWQFVTNLILDNVLIYARLLLLKATLWNIGQGKE